MNQTLREATRAAYEQWMLTRSDEDLETYKQTDRAERKANGN